MANGGLTLEQHRKLEKAIHDALDDDCQHKGLFKLCYDLEVDIAPTVAEMLQAERERGDRLARLLYEVMFDMHKVYGNTTGPYGGIGGAAMTAWCHLNSPYGSEETERVEEIRRIAHEEMADGGE